MKPMPVFLITSLLLLNSCIIRTSTEWTTPYDVADRNFSFIQTYEMPSTASLDIFTSGGNISTYGCDCDSIEVSFIISHRGKVLDMTLEELKVIAEVDITHKDSGLSIKISHVRPRSINVGFLIKTPFETTINLNTSGGNIMLEDIIGYQKIRTSGGNLNMNNLSGQIEANTSGGNIRIGNSMASFHAHTSGGNISINDVEGEVDVKTSGGNIHAENLSPTLHARTSGGNIHISSVEGNTDVSTSGGSIQLNDLTGSVKAYTSGGSVTATLNKLTGWLDLETSGGNINASIPSGLGLDLDLSADHISTKLQNFSGSSGKRRIQGQMNGGGILVRLRTSGGSLNLVYE